MKSIQLFNSKEYRKAKECLSSALQICENLKENSEDMLVLNLTFYMSLLTISEDNREHFARDNSGLSLARRKDATYFFRWIMSVIIDTTVQTCHQKAMGSKTMERRVSTVILNVYQSPEIEKEESSRQSLESHGKLDEIRRINNKKFDWVMTYVETWPEQKPI